MEWILSVNESLFCCISFAFEQVETSTGSVIPASFDRTSRCPDEIVRRIRVTASCEDPSWNGKLLESYDTQTDRFIIAPCCWWVSLLGLHLLLLVINDMLKQWNNIELCLLPSHTIIAFHIVLPFQSFVVVFELYEHF